MNQKGFTPIILIVIVLVVVGLFVAGFAFFRGNESESPVQNVVDGEVIWMFDNRDGEWKVSGNPPAAPIL